MLIAVTGAAGFVGRALVKDLSARGLPVRGLARTRNALSCASHANFESVIVGDIHAGTDWSHSLRDVDCVIHCAARAHILHETASNALAAYRIVNVAGTRHLAEQAATCGVKRLVYLSSVAACVSSAARIRSLAPTGSRVYRVPSLIRKVHGEKTEEGSRFARDDKPMPEDAYGVSKWEAEQALRDVSARTGLEVVIVRPPLVYGPGAKGNFRRLLGLAASGAPLPFGAVCNRRSLAGLANLVDLLIRCVDHPAAAGRTFLVSDGHDLSTPALIRGLRRALGKSPRLLPVPPSILRLAGRITGKAAEVERLIGSLQVDITHTREILGWTPPVSVDEGLRQTAQWYLSQP